MSDYVTDTHALIWHLTLDSRLSPAAREVFHHTDQGRHRVWIPGIVLVELVYLTEKLRLDQSVLDRVFNLLEPQPSNYPIADLNLGTVQALREIPREQVPDLPDRLIAATAKQLGCPLLTRDSAMSRVEGVSVVW